MSEETSQKLLESVWSAEPEPDYIEMELGVLREMIGMSKETPATHIQMFLSLCKEQQIPERSIVVLTPGNARLLTDGAGHLMERL
jgi:hypothetical protein